MCGVCVCGVCVRERERERENNMLLLSAKTVDTPHLHPPLLLGTSVNKVGLVFEVDDRCEGICHFPETEKNSAAWIIDKDLLIIKFIIFPGNCIIKLVRLIFDYKTV